MNVLQIFVFNHSPACYSKYFPKTLFLGLQTLQNCFVFGFKVDLDLAEIQKHVLLKNKGKNEITETIARFRAGKTGK